MKPSARIQASIDLMGRVYDGRVPMDTTCGDYFRVRRYIGSKDRAAIVERVYDMMRMHARLGYILEQHKIDDTARNRVIAHLLLEYSPIGNVNKMFCETNFCPNKN